MVHGPGRIAVTLMRGGSSKGVFVREEDLPPPGTERDGFLLALMGSPDPMQVDGLGGGTSSTSKVVAVATARTRGCDLEYTVYQVGTDRAVVDSRGNCGNLTAAVALYALDEGLIHAGRGAFDVVLHNLNTDSRIDARTERSGARTAVVTEYLDPAGSVCDRLFPACNVPLIRLAPRIGDPVDATIVDVTAPVVIVAAGQLGLDPTLVPVDANANSPLLERLESIRAAAAVAAGLVDDESDALAGSPAVPRVAIVGSARRHVLPSGSTLELADHDLVVRSTSMQRMHHAIPLTTAMCVAAAAVIPGTLPFALGQPDPSGVRLAHPKGIVAVAVRPGPGPAPEIVSVAVQRTARRLLRGFADV